jgi:hypothetical protein
MAPIVAQLSAILLWLAKSEQWGITEAINGKFYTFPIVFNSRPRVIVSHDGSTAQIIRIYDIGPGGFNHENIFKDGAPASGADCMFIAVGY